MDWFNGSAGAENGYEGPREYQRLQLVREKLGISLEEVSRIMGVSLEQARKEELPTSDLSLTQLHRWQKALRVSFRELLICEKDPMSLPGLSVESLIDMHNLANSSVSTFASELSRQLSELVDSAEQPFADVIDEDDEEEPEKDNSDSLESKTHPNGSGSEGTRFSPLRTGRRLPSAVSLGVTRRVVEHFTKRSEAT
jgi:transcriptional regulator with XRE-family HTH domain